MPRGKPLLYLSDEMKKRLAKTRDYEKQYAFPKVTIYDKQMTVPEFVREAGSTDPEWSNVFNAIGHDIQKVLNPEYDFYGTCLFWGAFFRALENIKTRENLSEKAISMDAENRGDRQHG